MKVVCQGCQGEIEFPEPQNPRIINLPAVSMIVLEHPHRFICPECGVAITHGLSGGEALAIIAIPLPQDQQPRTVSPILAPSGLNIVKN